MKFFIVPLFFLPSAFCCPDLSGNYQYCDLRKQSLVVKQNGNLYKMSHEKFIADGKVYHSEEYKGDSLISYDRMSECVGDHLIYHYRKRSDGYVVANFTYDFYKIENKMIKKSFGQILGFELNETETCQ